MYAYLHKRIRNDEHCPNCRKYWLTVFESQQQFYQQQLYQQQLSYENIPLLNCDNKHTIWVDEWIRRRNGDQYTIQPINYELSYNLNNFEDYELNNGPNINATHMLLHIIIDNDKDCPDNIMFDIKFYDCERFSVSYHLIPNKQDRHQLYCQKEFKLIRGTRLDYFQFIKLEPGVPIEINAVDLFNEMCVN